MSNSSSNSYANAQADAAAIQRGLRKFTNLLSLVLQKADPKSCDEFQMLYRRWRVLGREGDQMSLGLRELRSQMELAEGRAKGGIKFQLMTQTALLICEAVLNPLKHPKFKLERTKLILAERLNAIDKGHKFQRPMDATDSDDDAEAEL